MIKRIVFSVVVLLLTNGYAFAYECSNISSYIDDAHRYLKRAADETDLYYAQDYMRKAKNSLEEVSYAANDCGCSYASSEFDDASTMSRRAQNASDADDFVYQFNRAVKAYNAGIEALRNCFQQ